METRTAPREIRRVLFVTDFYQEEELLGIVDHARGGNWELISNMRFHGMFPSETEADGILVTAHGERVREWISRWKTTPCVHIGEPAPGVELPWVDIDYLEAARLGARHLLELGHLDFAYYTLVDWEIARRMRAAFAAELRAAKRDVTFIDFSEKHGPESLEIPRAERLRWLAAKLGELKKPAAVMGDDDRRALELIAACDMRGLRIPEDISILGCDNRAVEVNLSRLPLSSVDMNRRLLGRRAAEMLDLLMDGKPVVSGTHIAPLRVFGRASTATFVTDSEEITRTLLHIRGNFSQSLAVNALARMAGMSERTYRAEFKRLVGHSPRTEIRRARLAAVTALLRDTELKLDAVAFESGFRNARNLCEVFAETYGMTPTEWRSRAQEQGK